jgi:transposase
MAHTMDEKSRFIEMRAKGYSFVKIAAETGVSKPTLIKWAVEYEDEIETLTATELQALLEQHGLTRQQESEHIAQQLERVRQAIEAQDLAKLPVRDLLLMKKNLEEKLEKHQRRSSIHTGMDKPGRDLFSAEEKMLPVN